MDDADWNFQTGNTECNFGYFVNSAHAVRHKIQFLDDQSTHLTIMVEKMDLDENGNGNGKWE